MGNKIGSLPAMLEGHLKDFAQMFGHIDYSDIMNFGHRPEKDIDLAYKYLVNMDKDGFFESDIVTDRPRSNENYLNLTLLIKNK
jgi:hypothetical protein